MLGELSVEKPGVNLPRMCLPTDGLNPAAEVSGERIEIQLQASAGKYGQAIRSQYFYEGVYDRMSHGLSARSDFQYGDNLGAGVDREPNPECVGARTGLGAQFI